MKKHLVIAKKVRNGRYYEITANRTWLGGNVQPYFSVLHKEGRATKSGMLDKRYAICECACSSNVKSIFPELKELFEFHLRHEDGTPMYEIENTLYFIKEKNVDLVMNQLLISEKEAKSLIETLDGDGEDKEGLAKYIRVNHLHEKWLAKANELKEKYNLPLSDERH